MTIELDEERPTFPGLILRNIGDRVDIAIADKAVVPWREYGSKEVKVGKDGQPRTQEKYVVVVVANHGAVFIENERDEQATPGMEASLWLAGHNRWERIEAYRRDLDGRGVRVGDVWRWEYARDERSTVAGMNDKKVRTITARAARAEESSLVSTCEALFRRLHSSTIELDRGDQGATYGDEEPF